jgi:hypothetical protein
MSTTFKTLLSLTTFAAFFVSATVLADYRDHNDKAWNSVYKRSHSVATTVARSEAAPVTVAQAPAKERAYSYEPSKDAGSAPATNAAPKVTRSNRSFSYEPATSAPVLAGGRNSISSGFSIDVGRRAKGY